MIRRPPRCTRTDTLFPYTTLFRSEGFPVAEEEGLVRDHRLDHLADEGRPRVLHQVANEPVDRAAVQAAGDRGEAALDQVGLVRRQDEAALPADQPRDEVEFLRRHRSAPPAIRASRGPISDIPTISLQIPARATAPGMPQTTLVASSWAITRPPASTTARQPASPSWPIPVRISASTPSFQAADRLRSIGSTEGRQKFSRGPWSSRMKRRPSRATTLM